jgi:nitrogen fixation NifU-like protein
VRERAGARARGRARHPSARAARPTGTLNKKDPKVGVGLVGAPACGDVMQLTVRAGAACSPHVGACHAPPPLCAWQIKVGEDGRIEDAKFKTFGCGSAIASRCAG